MKTWNFELEVEEGHDEFWGSLDKDNQHQLVKDLLLDILYANKIPSRIKLTKFAQIVDFDEDFQDREEDPASVNSIEASG